MTFSCWTLATPARTIGIHVIAKGLIQLYFHELLDGTYAIPPTIIFIYTLIFILFSITLIRTVIIRGFFEWIIELLI